MFEYPLINYLPGLVLYLVFFFPGFVLGCFLGWRAHITYLMALDGSLQKEGYRPDSRPSPPPCRCHQSDP